MLLEEFVLIPKKMYMEESPAVNQVLSNSQIQSKAKQLSLLQRYSSAEDKNRALTKNADRVPIETLDTGIQAQDEKRDECQRKLSQLASNTLLKNSSSYHVINFCGAKLYCKKFRNRQK